MTLGNGVLNTPGCYPGKFGADRGRLRGALSHTMERRATKKGIRHSPGRHAAVTPVDPAGPDCYRGGAKPWESHDPPLRGVADG